MTAEPGKLALRSHQPLHILYRDDDREDTEDAVLAIMRGGAVWERRGYGQILRLAISQPAQHSSGAGLDVAGMLARHEAAIQRDPSRELALVEAAEFLLRERIVSEPCRTWDSRWRTYGDIGHGGWQNPGEKSEIWMWEFSAGRLETDLRPSDEAHSQADYRKCDRITAKGRVDPATGEGSIWFNTNGRAGQRRVVEALLSRFPGTAFWVYPESSEPVRLQRYWEINLAD